MSDETLTLNSATQQILGTARELGRHRGDDKPDDRHLLAALIHAEPEMAEDLLKEAGFTPAVAGRLLQNPLQLLAIDGVETPAIDISPGATAALRANAEREVDCRALAVAILAHPGPALEEALDRLKSPPAAREAGGPYVTNRDYLDDVRELWRRRDQTWNNPVALRQARCHITELARSMAARCALSAPGRLLPLRLRQRHGLTTLEGEMLDLAMARECFGEPWIESVREVADCLGSTGCLRRLGAVLAAAERLDRHGLIARHPFEADCPWRVAHTIFLQPTVARALLGALAEDPLSEKEVGAVDEELGGLL